jgi:hypothetical protein
MRLSTMFRNIGFTRSWQARCPACGRVVGLSELGWKRDAPRAMVKRSFGWCRACRTLRLLIIEPARRHAGD